MKMCCIQCEQSEREGECEGSFAKVGLLRAHWECWSKCNLACDFCYRTISATVGTDQALSLLASLRYAGVRTIVFAGGDPSLRKDLEKLVSFSKALKMKVEVQTNAERLSKNFVASLMACDRIGLSLDGWNDETHDRFRSRPGNFDRVLGLLETLNASKVPVTVRSVVARGNFESIHLLGKVLVKFANVKQWSLMQFTPRGSGYLNFDKHMVTDSEFRETALSAISVAPGILDYYTNRSKVGAYCLIRSDGQVYGISDKMLMHDLPIGSIFDTHLTELAQKLPFSHLAHGNRYRNIDSR